VNREKGATNQHFQGEDLAKKVNPALENPCVRFAKPKWIAAKRVNLALENPTFPKE
jgi:hypothetical protein